jgi:plasmid stabilization system protein ParE
MPVIKVSAAAEEDLKEIWAYVAENNLEAAGRLIKEITRRFAILRDHPHMGESNISCWSICEVSWSKTTSSSISRPRAG